MGVCFTFYSSSDVHLPVGPLVLGLCKTKKVWPKMMHTAVCGIARRAGAGSRCVLVRCAVSVCLTKLLLNQASSTYCFTSDCKDAFDDKYAGISYFIYSGVSKLTHLQSSHFFRPRPLAQGFAALPGSTRNISLSSSKPAPANASNSATPEETIPSEVAAQPSASDAANAVSENLSQASSVVSSDASIVSDASSTLAETLSSVPVDALTSIAPLHYGDLTAAGLTSFWPPGLCVWGLETLQVATGMPWFWTIVVGTFAARFVLIPFAASSMSNAAKLAEHQPELQAVQAQVKAAFESKNQFEMQRAALAQRALFKRIGVNPMKNFIPMFVQLPVTIGLFLGVKRMCDLPVEQLKVSGVSFLTDLTVPDPTWVLPILGAVVMNLQITVCTLHSY